MVNHIARKENLTYIEARSAFERFVKKCLIELNNGKQIRFRKVGIIFMDKDRNILFEPDKTQNYLGASFGLKSFVSPSVKHTIIRPTTKSSKTIAKDRTPKETAKREIKPKVKNGPKYVNINISFILVVLAIAALFYFKSATVKEYYNNYASIIPFFYSSPNEYIAKNLDEAPMMSVLTLVDKLSSPEATPKTKKDTTKKQKQDVKSTEKPSSEPSEKPKQQDSQKPTPTKKEVEEEKQKPDTKPGIIAQSKSDTQFNHFIIAGVFREKANAIRMTQNLKAKGFNAKIVDQTHGGLYRVCFDAFSSKQEANKQLAVIRKDEEAAAWLLSI